ncbi:hypothetical protein ACUNWD_13265 [Sunxiuqinia sp. A32]|uniref:hypothetical protein n=1 Tax=Sunxiuqinia sp. A32 TaxID=3461496 RepID=UPI0040456801
MKKFAMLMLVAFCATFASNSAVASGVKDLKGAWKYSVPSAAYEYSTGQLIVDEIDGVLDVKIKFMDGTQIKGEQVKFEEGKLSFGVYIDYELIKVNLEMKEGKLVGKVNSPEGIMDFSAEKKE